MIYNIIKLYLTLLIGGSNLKMRGKKMLKQYIKIIFSIITLLILIIPIISTSSSSDFVNNLEGFDKGPSYLPVIPSKKITFFNDGFAEEIITSML